ncbi:hypothetical protein [Piscibacillus salipiscarius]|nr:hypothetical protein [Piscibacillus salipiscarius]
MKKLIVLIGVLAFLLIPLQTVFADDASASAKQEYLVEFDGPAKKVS